MGPYSNWTWWLFARGTNYSGRVLSLFYRSYGSIKLVKSAITRTLLKFSLISILEFLSIHITKDEMKLQQIHKVRFSLFSIEHMIYCDFQKILICTYRVYLSTHIHLECQLNGITRREEIDKYFRSRALEACLNNTNLSLIEY